MPFVDELKPDTRVFALFVSRSGGGKSTAAASFPKPEFMDFDGRIRGVINSLHLFKDRISFEQFLPPKGWDAIDKYIELLHMQCMQKINSVQTLIPDSITSFCNLMISESIRIQEGRVIKGNGSKSKGLRIAGINDYQYEVSAVYQFFSCLRSLTSYINIIATAHIIPRFEKPLLRDTRGETTHSSDGELVHNPFAEMEEVGETLAIRAKVEANTLIFFDEVYRFEKKQDNKGNIKYYVNFDTDLARSALGLKGEHDITDKNFYDFWKEEVNKVYESSKSRRISTN
jgi:hypothetical protein